jgi:flagellar hook-basal body complex protein FliE
MTPAQSISQVASAYAKAARGPGAQGMEARDDGEAGGGFADLVKSALREAGRIAEESEQMSIQGIQDRADLNQVITAVAEAEVTLQTVVTIRDKVLEAYKEIVRMPI